MQCRRRGVEFNPHPMTRKYRNPINLWSVPLNCHRFFCNADDFAQQTAAHRCADGPGEQTHLQSGERQHRPESLQGEKRGDDKRRPAERPNEQASSASIQRSMGCQLKPPHRNVTHWQRPVPGLRAQYNAVAHAIATDNIQGQAEGAQSYRRLECRRNAQIADSKGIFILQRGVDQTLSAGFSHPLIVGGSRYLQVDGQVDHKPPSIKFI